MNPISFLTPAPAPGAPGAQRTPGSAAAAPGQFGALLSSLLGAGENTAEAGTEAPIEGIQAQPNPDTADPGTGTGLPVPGFVLPEELRAPVAGLGLVAGTEEQTGAPVPDATEAETSDPATTDPQTTAPRTSAVPAAAPGTVQQPADTRLPVAALQQPVPADEPAVQEPATDADGFTVAAAKTAPAPADRVQAPARSLPAAGVIPVDTDQNRVAVQAPAANRVPIISPTPVATAAAPATALLSPLLIPVDETPGGTMPVGLTAGSVQLEPVTAAAPTQAPAPVRPLHAEPLHRQLAGPLLMLATGPHGERTLSIQVAPEALGPITVKAVIGAEGLRVELTAPGEAGREALRTMLPDLRRELASTGAGTVHIGTGSDQGAGNGPASGGAGHFAPGRQTPGTAPGSRQGNTEPLPEPTTSATSTTRSSGLDILA